MSRTHVDSNTLPAEPSTPTNPVDVVLTVARQVIVDDQGDLLDVYTSSPDVGRDQDSGGTLTELGHDRVSFLLRHVCRDKRGCKSGSDHRIRIQCQRTSVHLSNGKVGVPHLFCQPIDLDALFVSTPLEQTLSPAKRQLTFLLVLQKMTA